MAIKRILVATDGSATAQAAMAWAADLAAPLGAEVVVISVIDIAALYPGALYLPVSEEQMRERLDKELNDAWTERMRDRGVPFRTLLGEGNPAAVIVKTAVAEKADLIVMGSRGHGDFTELLIGSVAHHVTHHARTPVVIVPPSAVTAAQSAGAASPEERSDSPGQARPAEHTAETAAARS
jgi:nucleotide-binding universal stress UspA family protein